MAVADRHDCRFLSASTVPRPHEVTLSDFHLSPDGYSTHRRTWSVTTPMTRTNSAPS